MPDDVLEWPHWRDAPANEWRWPNFSPAEIACRGTGRLLVNEAALDRLQALRDCLGKPLIVRSGLFFRSFQASARGQPRPCFRLNALGSRDAGRYGPSRA